MPDFQFQEMFPGGKDTHALPQADRRFRRHDAGSTAATVLTVAPEALTQLAVQAFRDVSHLLRPGPSRAAARDPRRSRGLGQRPLRRARPAEERQHRRRRRAADVPGHRHRDRVRQEGPARGGRRRRGGADRLGRPPHLHRDQPALLADGAAVDVRGGQHRQQPAGAVRHLCAATGDAYEFLFVAKGGGSANKSFLFQETPAILNPSGAAEVPRHQDPHARHRRLPALSPGDRDRRHLGRDDAEDGEARLDALSRRPADEGTQGRAIPRPRDGAEGARADPPDGHRRAVRRQVFLPRRARDPPAAPRRLAADRHRRVLLGRPPDHGQDHPGRRVPRAARDRSGEVPARDRPQQLSGEVVRST